ncbi:peptide-methionine (S)-S-oxide reductase MsrA [Enterobacter sp. CC120223-11]|uniref:peptide-methionine (S)-S-oxide reductase MsrA n=1 Tax=Enterobacter sp. CC120223-11 TaxID=1378073 RepID=UPI000BCAB1CF|nr:peptide-methionine (S)-S-oxide reductase MsrA [Enterobacter sp. CC120223-11]SNY69846.1 peptide-methionine (S)-S-oxide reductase [Enterobacter sp. CC120223-11]
MKLKNLSTAALLVATVVFQNAGWSQSQVLPLPAQDETLAKSGLEKAVFAGGCFWGVQGVFQHVQGVSSAVSGYAGGKARTANYPTVSTGMTGHAESVSVTFDPTKVTYGQLLQIFFSVVHDPTELNKQGPDYGTQYRSALFVQSAEQEKVARAYIAQLGAGHYFSAPIVTRIEDKTAFYPAEKYHQNFLHDNPTNPYIEINDQPKVQALKKDFPAIWQAEPVLVKE